MSRLSKLFGETPEKQSANKKMLLGGIASSLVYWGNFLAEEQASYPPELKQRIDPHLPLNGDLIAGLAPPLALYSIVKFGKKQKLRDLAKGSILFSLPHMTARTIVQSAWQVGLDSKPPPAARLPTNSAVSRYIAPIQNSRPAAPSGLSKYAITG